MKRSPYIESIRGFAILLVVMGHVIGESVTGGMRVGDDSIWRYLYFNIDKLQMPLFTLISGWVYAIRPFSAGQKFGRFAGQKAQRILVPMLAVASLYYLLKTLTGGEDSEQLSKIWELLVFPYNVYWYLPSLFWLFIVTGFFDKHRYLDQPASLFWFLIASILFYKYQDFIIPKTVLNYFSFKGSIYLMPFFLSGIAIQRFKNILSNKRFVTGLWCVFIACMVMVQLVWFRIIGDGYTEYGRNSWLGIITGLSSAVLLFSRIHIRWLVWTGGFSYTIYLFHSIAKGVSQSALLKLGINNECIVFICGVAAGLLIPILIDKILEKWKLTKFIFLGKK